MPGQGDWMERFRERGRKKRARASERRNSSASARESESSSSGAEVGGTRDAESTPEELQLPATHSHSSAARPRPGIDYGSSSTRMLARPSVQRNQQQQFISRSQQARSVDPEDAALALALSLSVSDNCAEHSPSAVLESLMLSGEHSPLASGHSSLLESFPAMVDAFDTSPFDADPLEHMSYEELSSLENVKTVLPRGYVSTFPAADSEKECLVCYEAHTAGAGSSSVQLPCSHTFHDECARRWLEEESKLCPVCKAEASSARELRDGSCARR